MELEIFQNMLMLIFATTFIIGWVVSKTDFCTMVSLADLKFIPNKWRCLDHV